MPMNCCVYGCGNNNKNNPDKQFFRLPTESERLSLWVSLIGRKELLKYGKITQRICCDHFEEDNYYAVKFLKKDAIPSLNLPPFIDKEEPDAAGSPKGEEARQLWLKLRNSHREARRRRTEDKNLKPWKYEEEMEFLVKDDTSTTNDISVVSAEDNEFNSSYKIEVVESGADETDQEINSNEAMVDAVRERYNDELKLDVKSKLLIDRSTQYEGTNEGSNYNVQIQTNCFNGDRESDGLTALFSSMCEKTRNLSKLLQIRVQREIFESVMRAEEETLKIPTSRFMFRKRIANRRKRTRAATFKDCDKEDTQIQEQTCDPPSDPIGEFEIKTEINEHSIDID